MEPSPPSPPASGLSVDILRRAVSIYLDRAYPAGPPSEAVRRRLTWPEGVGLADLLARPPFEKVRDGNDAAGATIHALRLGNARYPHMKLQVQPWDSREGFLLSVNTHDHALSITPDSPDAAAFAALQAENQALKVEIEKAWDDAGLPTFPRYLRDYLLAHPGPDRNRIRVADSGEFR